jgi:hypothetical protein
MTGLCRICDSKDLGSPIELREVMFGTGEKFRYQRCSNCGCLQITEQPAEIVNIIWLVIIPMLRNQVERLDN